MFCHITAEQFGFHWADFHEIWCLIIFRKSVEKIQIALKSDNNFFCPASISLKIRKKQRIVEITYLSLLLLLLPAIG
jgi:hypothetical protein